MTKRPSAQVEADVYLRWKLVHLFLPVQKLPSCCEAVWLSLCLRLSSAVRLDCILYLKCSYVWETKCLTVRHAAVFCCCFFHSVSLPYVIQSSSQVCLIDPTTESLHTHPRHRASSSSHSCLTFVETDWGFEGWHGGSVATVDWSLASLSHRCLFRAFVLGQKIRFLFFFFVFVCFFCFSGAKQRSRQYNMSTVSANHRTVSYCMFCLCCFSLLCFGVFAFCKNQETEDISLAREEFAMGIFQSSSEAWTIER